MHTPVLAVRKFILWVSLPDLASTLLVAQNVTPHAPANTYHAPRSNLVAINSPELHADRTVTFRISAAGATDVRLWLDEDHAIVKDAGGIWRVTFGPRYFQQAA